MVMDQVRGPSLDFGLAVTLPGHEAGSPVEGEVGEVRGRSLALQKVLHEERGRCHRVLLQVLQHRCRGGKHHQELEPAARGKQ